MLLLDYLRYINIHFLPFSFFTADFHMVQFNYPQVLSFFSACLCFRPASGRPVSMFIASGVVVAGQPDGAQTKHNTHT